MKIFSRALSSLSFSACHCQLIIIYEKKRTQTMWKIPKRKFIFLPPFEERVKEQVLFSLIRRHVVWVIISFSKASSVLLISSNNLFFLTRV